MKNKLQEKPYSTTFGVDPKSTLLGVDPKTLPIFLKMKAKQQCIKQEKLIRAPTWNRTTI